MQQKSVLSPSVHPNVEIFTSGTVSTSIAQASSGSSTKAACCSLSIRPAKRFTTMKLSSSVFEPTKVTVAWESPVDQFPIAIYATRATIRFVCTEAKPSAKIENFAQVVYSYFYNVCSTRLSFELSIERVYSGLCLLWKQSTLSIF